MSDYYQDIQDMAPAGDYQGTKDMPADLAAERSVLSAMMLSPEVLENAIIALDKDDFFYEPNRILFDALSSMYERAIPIDTISIIDYLTSKKEIEHVGGPKAIALLSEDSFSIASWQHHADIIHRDSTLRMMIGAASEINNLAYNAPEDTKEVVASAEKMLLDVTNRDIKTGQINLSDAVAKLYGDLQEMYEKGNHFQGVRTGFAKVDKAFLGLRPGQMVVIGARPGVGKTAFALNLAASVAEQGASVAFFSLEMSADELAQRLVSMYSQIPLQDLRSANIKKPQWQSIVNATNQLSNLDFMIDDTPGTTITEVRAKARRMLRGKENGIVILDYLQLVSPPAGRRSDSRATEVSEMSRGIKIMAKDLGIPVIALSQLNRNNEQRASKTGGKKPQLSDLRESGSIEQDADIVVLLDRSFTEEEGNRPDRPDFGHTDFIIAKNRSGPLSTIDMIFFAERSKYMEYDGTKQE